MSSPARLALLLSLASVSFACGGATSPATKPDTAASAPGSQAEWPGAERIAIVDVDRVLAETPQGRLAAKQLQAAKEQAAAQVKAMEGEIESTAKEIKEMEEQGASDAELRVEMQRLAAMQQQAQQATKGLEAQLEQGRQQLLAPLISELAHVSGRLAEDAGYELVLDRAGTPYAVDESDLTDQVIARLKELATEEGLEDDGTGGSGATESLRPDSDRKIDIFSPGPGGSESDEPSLTPGPSLTP